MQPCIPLSSHVVCSEGGGGCILASQGRAGCVIIPSPWRATKTNSGREGSGSGREVQINGADLPYENFQREISAGLEGGVVGAGSLPKRSSSGAFEGVAVCAGGNL